MYKLAEKFCALINDPHGEDPLKLHQFSGFVVFISNPNRQTPIWCQKSAKSSDAPVIWDYHVIFLLTRTEDAKQVRSTADHHVLSKPVSATFVIDLDTNLGYPVLFDHYVKSSFRPEIKLRKYFKQ